MRNAIIQVKHMFRRQCFRSPSKQAIGETDHSVLIICQCSVPNVFECKKKLLCQRDQMSLLPLVEFSPRELLECLFQQLSLSQDQCCFTALDYLLMFFRKFIFKQYKQKLSCHQTFTIPQISLYLQIKTSASITSLPLSMYVCMYVHTHTWQLQYSILEFGVWNMNYIINLYTFSLIFYPFKFQLFFFL